MIEKIENSLKDLLTSLQTARLYGARHPLTEKSIAKAHSSLRDVLTEKAELVIGIIGEELVFEKEVFFELSSFLKPMVTHLKERGIERIAFGRALEFSELNKFMEFLTLPKEELRGEPGELLKLAGVHNISIGKIKVSSLTGSADKDPAPAKANLYQVSLESISEPLTKIMNSEAFDGLTLKLVLSNIVNNLGAYYQQLFKLATLKRYDVGTFTHLLNVSILSMHFSSRLGFTKDVVTEIGLAALFHDIGKLHISRKTIRKPGQLSIQEFAQIESHTTLGAKLLMQYVQTIGIMPVVVSFEHHLKYDLSGYPRPPFKHKQHIASAIVSVCDVYDALSQRRSYKTDYPPDMIHGIMMRGSGAAFEPGLLNTFFKIIGVWPIGSILLLSDQRVGVVVEENEDNIFLPKVKVVSPENNGEVINLKETKDGLKIERYLSPWNQGKEFLHLL